ncbi:hypothetical protein UY3_18348 [Chelonia mydas]|uniref:Uncharacterized protein n=1 Tax=Chelonia mydas TaxID=8469 RepID=M7AJN0_CHEMY|nr:hypothetical protein UY3_18348 [Chelonia mydas]
MLDLIYTQFSVFQIIQRTCTETESEGSSKYLMDHISRLGRLISMVPFHSQMNNGTYDPSFSRIQTFMAWMVLLIFLIAIGGLSATIFVFTRQILAPFELLQERKRDGN